MIRAGNNRIDRWTKFSTERNHLVTDTPGNRRALVTDEAHIDFKEPLAMILLREDLRLYRQHQVFPSESPPCPHRFFAVLHSSHFR
jgi:hypothetical protein